MIAMIAAIVILQTLTLLSISAYVIWQWRFRFDVKRVADVMAANLIDEYQDDVYQLNEKGVKDYARKKYLELSFAVGLPSGLADYVADRVAAHIVNVQAATEQHVGVEPIYG